MQLRELIVVKTEGRKEPFEREKLERSIMVACRKRHITAEQIAQLATSIQRQVETAGESEISTTAIGALVMEALKRLDSVAYIRFASVYKDFTEASDFEDFASSIKEAGGA